jgi:hypothetical protein
LGRPITFRICIPKYTSYCYKSNISLDQSEITSRSKTKSPLAAGAHCGARRIILLDSCVHCRAIKQKLVCFVGDSPEGPLKTTGEIPLKTCKKPKLNTSCLSTHTGHDPRCGGPRGPPRRPTQRSPRAGSASLEGACLPRAGSAPLEGARIPRAGSAPFEGTRLPRAGSASLEGAPHAHACSRTRVRAFNALTTAGRRHHAPETRAPALLHQLPRGNPSPPLWGTVRHGRC